MNFRKLKDGGSSEVFMLLLIFIKQNCDGNSYKSLTRDYNTVKLLKFPVFSATVLVMRSIIANTDAIQVVEEVIEWR